MTVRRLTHAVRRKTEGADQRPDLRQRQRRMQRFGEHPLLMRIGPRRVESDQFLQDQGFLDCFRRQPG